MLNALSNGKFPTWAGVIVICTSVWIICALGISWIHRLDTYVWIPPLIVWCVAAGTGASSFTSEPSKHLQGADKAAAVLTYMASIFSFSVSWVNCAADYNVRMPVDTPRWKIFSATYIGIFVPTVLVQSLGAAMYSGVVTNVAWKDAYTSSSIGGLLKMALEPAGGFGKFLMVLAALSAIPVNLWLVPGFISIIFSDHSHRTTFPTTIPSRSTRKISAYGRCAFPESFSSHLASWFLSS